MSARTDKTPLIVCDDHGQAFARVKTLVKSVPAYRDLCPGVDSVRVNTLADLLALLPVVNKADLFEFGEHAYTLPSSKIMLFSETSGTTGKPLPTPRGRDEFSWNMFNQASAYRQHIQAGLDRVAILHPSVMSPFVEVSARALQELGVGYVRVFPIPKVCDYKRLFRIMGDHGITAIMSTPTLIYKMLYEFKAQCEGKLPAVLNKLLLTGEYITLANLKNFDAILDRGAGAARSFVYGSSEVATVMYGVADASYRAYLHDFVFEIIPSDAPWVGELERPCDSAVTGELLVTWLRDGVMPMLRYNTGDIFTVWQDLRGQNAGPWHFRAEGRGHDELITPYLRTAIDAAVYGTDYPVYYYDVDVYDDRLAFTLIAEDTADAAVLSQQLSEQLKSLGMAVDVSVNDKSHGFYDFSPLPKSSSYTRKKDV